MKASILIKQSPLSLSDTLILLEHITNIDKNTIYLHQKDIDVDFEAFNKIAINVLRGMPIQYVLKKWWFFGEEFFVKPPVLIPRPETELLVEYAINMVKDFKIGFEPFVGSGIISIILLKHIKHLKMIATDINKEACKLTLENAKLHNVENRLLVLCSDIGNALDSSNIDFIVANPPYIPTDKLKTLDKSVLDYEDIKALDGKEDGLFFYKSLKTLNIKPMILEIGHDQEKSMRELFDNVDVIYDYQNHPRIAILK